MTPGQRHRQRIEAIKAGTAQVTVAQAPATPVQVGLPSIATRHRVRTSAAAAAALAVAAQAAALAANDNSPVDAAPASTEIPAYHMQILALAEDRRRLKQIQSVEAKVSLKRELLPAYEAWVQGYLQSAADAGQAAQDDVVATVMVWRIDVGDYAGALEIAAVLVKNRLSLPEQFARSPATYAIEAIAEAAISAVSTGKAFDLQLLLQLEDLADGQDMPDQVRAKLYKAIGAELLRQADDPNADASVAGGRKARLAAAQEALNRALQLHEKCGVKKDLEKVARELNKEQASAS